MLGRIIEWSARNVFLVLLGTAFVIGLGMFAGLGFAANVDGRATIPTWKALGGALVAIVAMAAYLWRGHPGLVRSFSEVPLGDETDSVPHAPDR